MPSLTSILVYDEGPSLVGLGQPVIDSTGALYVARTQFGFGCGYGVCSQSLQKLAFGNSDSGWIQQNLSNDSLATLGVAIGPNDRIYFQPDRNTLWAFEANGISSSGSWPVAFLSDRFSMNTLIDSATGEVFGQTRSVGACFDSCSQYFAALKSTGETMWSWMTTTSAAGFQARTIFLGPGRDLYALTPTSFARYDRETGGTPFPGADPVPSCQTSLNTPGFYGVVGNQSGIFSSFQSTITAYGSGCAVRDIFTVPPDRNDLTVWTIVNGMLLATDDPASGLFNAADRRLIGVAADGSTSWRNESFGPDLADPVLGPVRAVSGSTVYVLGLDPLDANKRKLYSVNGGNGNLVAQPLDLTTICDNCGVAVDSTGNIYINDRSSTRIFRIANPF